MDALQILGSLLGNNATSSSTGNQILTQLANSLSSDSQAGLAINRAAVAGLPPPAVSLRR